MENLKKQLNDQALAIVENQQSFTQSRKSLSEQTREFRKLDDSMKLLQIKPLLKSYQSEIDNITNRSKTVEKFIMDLHSKISNLDLLELDESRKHANIDIDALINEKLEQREKEWKDALESSKKVFADTEASLLKQIDFLKEHSKKEIISVQNPSTLEFEMLTAELDKLKNLNSRLVLENRMLNEQLLDFERNSAKKLEAEHEQAILEYQNEIKQLQKQLERIDVLQQRVQSQSDQLEQTLQENNSLKQNIQQLENTLEGYSDYEALQNELKMLKLMEFQQQDLPLEQLILQKNRKLESELQTLRTAISSKDEEIEKIKSSFETIVNQLEAKTKLAEKLDGDLEKLNKKQMFGMQNDKGIVPILTSQRDRYKQRYEQLDARNRNLNSEITDLKQQLDEYKRDNLKMYEKVRFMEFKSRPGDSLRDMQKYASSYEESLDPFKQFHIQVFQIYKRKNEEGSVQ